MLGMVSWKFATVVQIQQWKRQDRVWYLFKFNSKATRTTSIIYCLLLTFSCWHFTHCPGVSIVVEFEQVMARNTLTRKVACNLEPETTFHYLLRCQLFQTERRTLFNYIKEIDDNIITDHKNYLDQILLYGNERYRYDTNRMILLSALKFYIDSKRFDLPLLFM